jgi:hypothetical protein
MVCACEYSYGEVLALEGICQAELIEPGHPEAGAND